MVESATVPNEQAVDHLVVALDIGTSSVRALIYDAEGNMVPEWGARRPYSVHATADGGVEIDADLLLRLVTECIGEVLGRIGPACERLTAVASDTFWHSVMGVDANGKAVTPVFTWADTRSAHAAAELRELIDAAAVHARTGAVLHPSYLPAKLFWLTQEQMGGVSDARYWMSFGEFLYLRLFGERRVSVSMASGTGLLDQQTCTWDPELVNVLNLEDSALSPIMEFSDALHTLRRPYADQWPQLNKLPWYLAIGDGAANNIGSGGCDASRWVLMIGTSGALRVVREEPYSPMPPGLWSYRVDRRRIVQGGAVSSGGNIFAWLSLALQVPPGPQLEKDLEAMQPDSHGLTVLPFFAGERSPSWRSDARGAVAGLTLATRPVDIVRASLESISYRFALISALLQESAPSPEAMIASGSGLLDSPAWMQIIADVMARPVAASAVPEASSRGAALLALEAQGLVQDVCAVFAPLGTEYAPVENRTAVYRAAARRQSRLYQKLVREWDVECR